MLYWEAPTQVLIMYYCWTHLATTAASAALMTAELAADFRPDLILSGKNKIGRN